MSQETVYSRVVFKIGGEALSGEGHTGIDFTEVQQIACKIKALQALGIQIGLVVGSGNFFRGHVGVRQGMDNEVTAHHMGMLATIINALALQDALERLQVPVRVMTGIEVRAVAEPYIQRRAIRHLEKGRVVIFGGGTGNPFFTTDTAAALRGREIKADIIIKATKVDAVYDQDPKQDSRATPFSRLSFSDAISKRVGVLDGTALTMCRDSNLPIAVVNLWHEDSLLRVVRGEAVGTIIS